ncbi:hypothetical protein Poli38472_000932 [Pythium oligandrum]|uniref:Uncharacterized protein n=1 Tax=Pythium oligandrum TaxID=41045 RepID=A0A8K1CDP3_PYTOL|nr:hypothetical protein Poli38472_000932 [Pythium oligandrum]|eukprot:TMW60890.1 hypothetical protein Poli38472_000932 [Pythium oligandrum]
MTASSDDHPPAEPAATPDASNSRVTNTASAFAPRKPSRIQPGKVKRKRNRKGWGPFQSVLKERSVDFNLTLDVQNLQQEIQQMTTMRDLLDTRVMMLRHSPSGSLMQIIDFLYSVVDSDIDFGNGLGGIDVMIEQIRRYSLFLRFIRMQMDAYDIVVTEDSVVIKAMGTLRFQILRETVAGLFPHVMGNECLVACLVGAEVEPAASLTFYFNKDDKIERYETDLDFVAIFTEVLPDPESVAMLLGKALIGGNNMFGVNEDGVMHDIHLISEEPEVESAIHDRQQGQPSGQVVSSGYSAHGYDQTPTEEVVYLLEKQAARLRHEVTTLQQRSQQLEAVIEHGGSWRRPLEVSKNTVATDAPFFYDVSDEYIRLFARGWNASSLTARLQEFLHTYTSPSVLYGQVRGRMHLETKWKTLMTAFDFIGCSVFEPPQLFGDEAQAMVRASVVYDLIIRDHTFDRVFPHVLAYPQLADDMVNRPISCVSLVEFWWDDLRERWVTRIVEDMDWDQAFQPLVLDDRTRAFVLSSALLEPEGVVSPRVKESRLLISSLVSNDADEQEYAAPGHVVML